MDIFGEVVHYSKVKGLSKRCSKCGKYKALRFFSHDNARSDSYRSTCKECDAKSQRKSREKIKYIQVEYKQCSVGGDIKPISMFGLDKTKKDGHRSYCLDCMREMARHRRHKELLKTTKLL